MKKENNIKVNLESLGYSELGYPSWITHISNYLYDIPNEKRNNPFIINLWNILQKYQQTVGKKEKEEYLILTEEEHETLGQFQEMIKKGELK